MPPDRAKDRWRGMRERGCERWLSLRVVEGGERACCRVVLFPFVGQNTFAGGLLVLGLWRMHHSSERMRQDRIRLDEHHSCGDTEWIFHTGRQCKFAFRP